MSSEQVTSQPGELILAAGANAQIGEIIGFVVIVAILARYIVPFARKAMGARQETIAAQLAASEAAGQKLAEAQAAYDNAVVEARAEAERLLADARAQHQAIVDEAAAAATARAAEIAARAREAIEAERVQAVRSLQAEIATMTVDLAEQAVLASLTDVEQQRRITERFLTELESGTVTGASTAAVGGAQ